MAEWILTAIGPDRPGLVDELAAVLHGAGANISDTWRFGLILTYSVGWVRQEENQYLSIAPETVGNLSPELQALTGREAHEALGVFDPRVIPV